MATSQAQLPQDADNQTYVTVHALLAGGLWLPYKEVFQDSIDEPPEVGSEIPFIAFLITHPTFGRLLFDLGMRKHAKGWPPALKATLEEFRVYEYCDEDIVDVLRKGSVDPGEIGKIIYSHLHWDHTGDPTLFPNADIILGAESRPLLEDAYPLNPDSCVNALPVNQKAEFIDFRNAGQDRKTLPFGPYECAIDYFGDGSLYLVDSPGHLPGHLAAAARIAPNSFVFLAGDTCHNRLCYSPGERLISEFNHDDIETARETVRRLVTLNEEYDNAVIIIAHERERKEEIPFFPEADLKDWAIAEIDKRKLRPRPRAK